MRPCRRRPPRTPPEGGRATGEPTRSPWLGGPQVVSSATKCTPPGSDTARLIRPPSSGWVLHIIPRRSAAVGGPTAVGRRVAVPDLRVDAAPTPRVRSEHRPPDSGESRTVSSAEDVVIDAAPLRRCRRCYGTELGWSAARR